MNQVSDYDDYSGGSTRWDEPEAEAPSPVVEARNPYTDPTKYVTGANFLATNDEQMEDMVDKMAVRFEENFFQDKKAKIKTEFYRKDGSVGIEEVSPFDVDGNYTEKGKEYINRVREFFSLAANDENRGTFFNEDTGKNEIHPDFQQFIDEPIKGSASRMDKFFLKGEAEDDFKANNPGKEMGYSDYVDYHNSKVTTEAAKIDPDNEEMANAWEERKKNDSINVDDVFLPNEEGKSPIIAEVNGRQMLNPNTLHRIDDVNAAIESAPVSRFEKRMMKLEYRERVNKIIPEIANKFNTAESGLLGAVGDSMAEMFGMEGDSLNNKLIAHIQAGKDGYSFLEEHKKELNEDNYGFMDRLGAATRDATLSLGTGALFLTGAAIDLIPGVDGAGKFLSGPAQIHGQFREEEKGGFGKTKIGELFGSEYHDEDLYDLSGQILSLAATGGASLAVKGGVSAVGRAAAGRAAVARATAVAARKGVPLTAAKIASARATGAALFDKAAVKKAGEFTAKKAGESFVKAAVTDVTAYMGGTQAAGMSFGRTYYNTLKETGDPEKAYHDAMIDGVSDALSATIATGVMNRFALGAEALLPGMKQATGMSMRQIFKKAVAGRQGMKAMQKELAKFVENKALRKAVAKQIGTGIGTAAKDAGLKGVALAKNIGAEAVEESMDEALSDVFKVMLDDSKTWSDGDWGNIHDNFKRYVKAGVLGAFGGGLGGAIHGTQSGVAGAFDKSPEGELRRMLIDHNIKQPWVRATKNIARFSENPKNLIRPDGTAVAMAEFLAAPESEVSMKEKVQTLANSVNLNTENFAKEFENISGPPVPGTSIPKPIPAGVKRAGFKPVKDQSDGGFPLTEDDKDVPGLDEDEQPGGSTWLMKKLFTVAPAGSKFRKGLLVTTKKPSKAFTNTKGEKVTITPISIGDSNTAAAFATDEKGQVKYLTAKEASEMLEGQKHKSLKGLKKAFEDADSEELANMRNWTEVDKTPAVPKAKKKRKRKKKTKAPTPTDTGTPTFVSGEELSKDAPKNPDGSINKKEFIKSVHDKVKEALDAGKRVVVTTAGGKRIEITGVDPLGLLDTEDDLFPTHSLIGKTDEGIDIEEKTEEEEKPEEKPEPLNEKARKLLEHYDSGGVLILGRTGTAEYIKSLGLDIPADSNEQQIIDALRAKQKAYEDSLKPDEEEQEEEKPEDEEEEESGEDEETSDTAPKPGFTSGDDILSLVKNEDGGYNSLDFLEIIMERVHAALKAGYRVFFDTDFGSRKTEITSVTSEGIFDKNGKKKNTSDLLNHPKDGIRIEEREEGEEAPPPPDRESWMPPVMSGKEVAEKANDDLKKAGMTDPNGHFSNPELYDLLELINKLGGKLIFAETQADALANFGVPNIYGKHPAVALAWSNGPLAILIRPEGMLRNSEEFMTMMREEYIHLQQFVFLRTPKGKELLAKTIGTVTKGHPDFDQKLEDWMLKEYGKSYAEKNPLGKLDEVIRAFVQGKLDLRTTGFRPKTNKKLAALFKGFMDYMDKLIKGSPALAEYASIIESRIREAEQALKQAKLDEYLDEIDEDTDQEEGESPDEDTAGIVDEELSDEEKQEAADELNEPWWTDKAAKKFNERFSAWMVSGREVSAKLVEFFKRVWKKMVQAGLGGMAFMSLNSDQMANSNQVNIVIDSLNPTVATSVTIAPTLANVALPADEGADVEVSTGIKPMVSEDDDSTGEIKTDGLEARAVDMGEAPTVSGPPIPEGMSPVAQEAFRQLYDALGENLRSSNKLLVITDKPTATVFVFNPDGSLLLQDKVLLGFMPGNYYKGNTDVKKNRITPAGLFTMGLRDAKRGGGEARTAGDYDFGKVFVLDKAIDGEYSVTLFHSVWTQESDAKQRLKALDETGPDNSRYSFGCINVRKSTYKRLLDNHQDQMDGAQLFIVPENTTDVDEFLSGDTARNVSGKDDLTRQSIPSKEESGLISRAKKRNRNRRRKLKAAGSGEETTEGEEEIVDPKKFKSEFRAFLLEHNPIDENRTPQQVINSMAGDSKNYSKFQSELPKYFKEFFNGFKFIDYAYGDMAKPTTTHIAKNIFHGQFPDEIGGKWDVKGKIATYTAPKGMAFTGPIGSLVEILGEEKFAQLNDIRKNKETGETIYVFKVIPFDDIIINKTDDAKKLINAGINWHENRLTKIAQKALPLIEKMGQGKKLSKGDMEMLLRKVFDEVAPKAGERLIGKDLPGTEFFNVSSRMDYRIDPNTSPEDRKRMKVGARRVPMVQVDYAKMANRMHQIFDGYESGDLRRDKLASIEMSRELAKLVEEEAIHDLALRVFSPEQMMELYDAVTSDDAPDTVKWLLAETEKQQGPDAKPLVIAAEMLRKLHQVRTTGSTTEMAGEGVRAIVRMLRSGKDEKGNTGIIKTIAGMLRRYTQQVKYLLSSAKMAMRLSPNLEKMLVDLHSAAIRENLMGDVDMIRQKAFQENRNNHQLFMKIMEQDLGEIARDESVSQGVVFLKNLHKTHFGHMRLDDFIRPNYETMELSLSPSVRKYLENSKDAEKLELIDKALLAFNSVNSLGDAARMMVNTQINLDRATAALDFDPRGLNGLSPELESALLANAPSDGTGKIPVMFGSKGLPDLYSHILDPDFQDSIREGIGYLSTLEGIVDDLKRRIRLAKPLRIQSIIQAISRLDLNNTRDRLTLMRIADIYGMEDLPDPDVFQQEKGVWERDAELMGWDPLGGKTEDEIEAMTDEERAEHNSKVMENAPKWVVEMEKRNRGLSPEELVRLSPEELAEYEQMKRDAGSPGIEWSRGVITAEEARNYRNNLWKARIIHNIRYLQAMGEDFTLKGFTENTGSGIIPGIEGLDRLSERERTEIRPNMSRQAMILLELEDPAPLAEELREAELKLEAAYGFSEETKSRKSAISKARGLDEYAKRIEDFDPDGAAIARMKSRWHKARIGLDMNKIAERQAQYAQYLKAKKEHQESVSFAMYRALGDFGVENEGFGMTFVKANGRNTNKLREAYDLESVFGDVFYRTEDTPPDLKGPEKLAEYNRLMSNAAFIGREHFVKFQTNLLHDPVNEVTEEAYNTLAGFAAIGVWDPDSGRTSYPRDHKLLPPLPHFQAMWEVREELIPNNDRPLTLSALKKNLIKNDYLGKLTEMKEWINQIERVFGKPNGHGSKYAYSVNGKQTLAGRFEKRMRLRIFEANKFLDSHWARIQRLTELVEGKHDLGRLKNEISSIFNPKIGGSFNDARRAMQLMRDDVNKMRRALHEFQNPELRKNVRKELDRATEDPTFIPSRATTDFLRNTRLHLPTYTNISFYMDYFSTNRPYRVGEVWAYELIEDYRNSNWSNEGNELVVDKEGETHRRSDLDEMGRPGRPSTSGDSRSSLDDSAMFSGDKNRIPKMTSMERRSLWMSKIRDMVKYRMTPSHMIEFVNHLVSAEAAAPVDMPIEILVKNSLKAIYKFTNEKGETDQNKLNSAYNAFVVQNKLSWKKSASGSLVDFNIKGRDRSNKTEYAPASQSDYNLKLVERPQLMRKKWMTKAAMMIGSSTGNPRESRQFVLDLMLKEVNLSNVTTMDLVRRALSGAFSMDRNLLDSEGNNLFDRILEDFLSRNPEWGPGDPNAPIPPTKTDYQMVLPLYYSVLPSLGKNFFKQRTPGIDAEKLLLDVLEMKSEYEQRAIKDLRIKSKPQLEAALKTLEHASKGELPGQVFKEDGELVYQAYLKQMTTSTPTLMSHQPTIDGISYISSNHLVSILVQSLSNSVVFTLNSKEANDANIKFPLRVFPSKDGKLPTVIFSTAEDRAGGRDESAMHIARALMTLAFEPTTIIDEKTGKKKQGRKLTEIGVLIDRFAKQTKDQFKLATSLNTLSQNQKPLVGEMRKILKDREMSKYVRKVRETHGDDMAALFQRYLKRYFRSMSELSNVLSQVDSGIKRTRSMFDKPQKAGYFQRKGSAGTNTPLFYPVRNPTRTITESYGKGLSGSDKGSIDISGLWGKSTMDNILFISELLTNENLKRMYDLVNVGYVQAKVPTLPVSVYERIARGVSMIATPHEELGLDYTKALERTSENENEDEDEYENPDFDVNEAATEMARQLSKETDPDFEEDEFENEDRLPIAGVKYTLHEMIRDLYHDPEAHGKWDENFADMFADYANGDLNSSDAALFNFISEIVEIAQNVRRKNKQEGFWKYELNPETGKREKVWVNGYRHVSELHKALMKQQLPAFFVDQKDSKGKFTVNPMNFDRPTASGGKLAMTKIFEASRRRIFNASMIGMTDEAQEALNEFDMMFEIEWANRREGDTPQDVARRCFGRDRITGERKEGLEVGLSKGMMEWMSDTLPEGMLGMQQLEVEEMIKGATKEADDIRQFLIDYQAKLQPFKDRIEVNEYLQNLDPDEFRKTEEAFRKNVLESVAEFAANRGNHRNQRTNFIASQFSRMSKSPNFRSIMDDLDWIVREMKSLDREKMDPDILKSVDKANVDQINSLIKRLDLTSNSSLRTIANQMFGLRIPDTFKFFDIGKLSTKDSQDSIEQKISKLRGIFNARKMAARIEDRIATLGENEATEELKEALIGAEFPVQTGSEKMTDEYNRPLGSKLANDLIKAMKGLKTEKEYLDAANQVITEHLSGTSQALGEIFPAKKAEFDRIRNLTTLMDQFATPDEQRAMLARQKDDEKVEAAERRIQLMKARLTALEKGLSNIQIEGGGPIEMGVMPHVVYFEDDDGITSRRVHLPIYLVDPYNDPVEFRKESMSLERAMEDFFNNHADDTYKQISKNLENYSDYDVKTLVKETLDVLKVEREIVAERWNDFENGGGSPITVEGLAELLEPEGGWDAHMLHADDPGPGISKAQKTRIRRIKGVESHKERRKRIGAILKDNNGGKVVVVPKDAEAHLAEWFSDVGDISNVDEAWDDIIFNAAAAPGPTGSKAGSYAMGFKQKDLETQEYEAWEQFDLTKNFEKTMGRPPTRKEAGDIFTDAFNVQMQGLIDSKQEKNGKGKNIDMSSKKVQDTMEMFSDLLRKIVYSHNRVGKKAFLGTELHARVAEFLKNLDQENFVKTENPSKKKRRYDHAKAINMDLMDLYTEVFADVEGSNMVRRLVTGVAGNLSDAELMLLSTFNHQDARTRRRFINSFVAYQEAVRLQGILERGFNGATGRNGYKSDYERYRKEVEAASRPLGTNWMDQSSGYVMASLEGILDSRDGTIIDNLALWIQQFNKGAFSLRDFDRAQRDQRGMVGRFFNAKHANLTADLEGVKSIHRLIKPHLDKLGDFSEISGTEAEMKAHRDAYATNVIRKTQEALLDNAKNRKGVKDYADALNKVFKELSDAMEVSKIVLSRTKEDVDKENPGKDLDPGLDPEAKFISTVPLRFHHAANPNYERIQLSEGKRKTDPLERTTLAQAALLGGSGRMDADAKSKGVYKLMELNGLSAVDSLIEDTLYRLNVTAPYEGLRKLVGKEDMSQTGFSQVSDDAKLLGGRVRSTKSFDDTTWKVALAAVAKEIENNINNDSQIGVHNTRFSKALEFSGTMFIFRALFSLFQIPAQTLSPVAGMVTKKVGVAMMEMMQKKMQTGKMGELRDFLTLFSQIGISTIVEMIPGGKHNQLFNNRNQRINEFIKRVSPWVQFRGTEGQDVMKQAKRRQITPGGSFVGRHLGHAGDTLINAMETGLDLVIARGERVVSRAIFMTELLAEMRRAKNNNEIDEAPKDIEELLDMHERDIPVFAAQYAHIKVSDMMGQADQAKKAKPFQSLSQSPTWSTIMRTGVRFSNHTATTAGNMTSLLPALMGEDAEMKSEAVENILGTLSQNIVFQLMKPRVLVPLVLYAIAKGRGDDDEEALRKAQEGANQLIAVQEDDGWIEKFLKQVTIGEGSELFDQGKDHRTAKYSAGAEIGSKLSAEMLHLLPVLGTLAGYSSISGLVKENVLEPASIGTASLLSDMFGEGIPTTGKESIDIPKYQSGPIEKVAGLSGPSSVLYDAIMAGTNVTRGLMNEEVAPKDLLAYSMSEIYATREFRRAKEKAVTDVLNKIDQKHQRSSKKKSGGTPSSTKEDDRNLVGLLFDSIRGLGIDPANVGKAVFTGEQLGDVEGNLVQLKRFHGADWKDAAGSDVAKERLIKAAGLLLAQKGNYKLEHIVPVGAGGDNSDSNLKIITNKDHHSYTNFDTMASSAVRGGAMTRKEVEKIATDLKQNKSITPKQAEDKVRSMAHAKKPDLKLRSQDDYKKYPRK